MTQGLGCEAGPLTQLRWIQTVGMAGGPCILNGLSGCEVNAERNASTNASGLILDIEDPAAVLAAGDLLGVLDGNHG